MVTELLDLLESGVLPNFVLEGQRPRHPARPVFALERLSLHQGRDRSPERIGCTLLRHKRSQRVGQGRKRKATAPGENGITTTGSADIPTPDQRPIITLQSLA